MKKYFVLLILAMVTLSAMSQAYHGQTTKEVKFRETAGDATPVIKTIPANTPVLIISLDSEKGYYNVIEISSGEEGYVLWEYIKVGKKVKGGDKGILKATGEIVTENPELDIINHTEKSLKLTINSEYFSIPAKDHKTITLSPGTFHYRAYSSGSIPISGKGKLKSNQRYTWDFNLTTPYSKE